MCYRRVHIGLNTTYNTAATDTMPRVSFGVPPLFLSRTALKDTLYGPPTTKCQPPQTINCRPPTATNGHLPPKADRKLPPTTSY